MREELARLLDSLTGTVRLGNADPRWDSLLRCGSRVLGLSLSETKMIDFCDALQRNNIETGNFGSLVALTVATVDEAVYTAFAVAAAAEDTAVGTTTSNRSEHSGSGDGDGNGTAAAAAAAAATAVAAAAAQHGPEGFPRALAALRLTRLFAARMVSTLDPSKLRAQVYSRGRRHDGIGTDGAATDGVDVDVDDDGDAGGAARGRRERGARGDTTGRGGGGDSVDIGGGSGAMITEGQEEGSAAEQSYNKPWGGGGAACADPVTALLASIMALLCATEEEGEGRVRGSGRRRRGRGGRGLLAVEGFSDLQLEGVGLLLVLLGTQAYAPPPPPLPPTSLDSSPPGTDGAGEHGSPDNVFLDALLREASTGIGRSRGWGTALPSAVFGWFIRRPDAPLGSAASALADALRAPPLPSSSSGDRHRRSSSARLAPSVDPVAASSSSSTATALPLPTTTSDVRGTSGNSGSTASDSVTVTPGQRGRRSQGAYGSALVFLFSAAILQLYVATVRGLFTVVGRSNTGGNGGSGGVLVDGDDDEEEEVTEAPGGAPREPGEWEGHRVVAATTASGDDDGGAGARDEADGAGAGAGWKRRNPRKISPLADRGLLLLLMLLRNRRRGNPFRAAVASCVDVEVDDNLPRGEFGSSSASSSSAGAAPAVPSPSASSAAAAAAAAAAPMRVSFRGLFEAFGSTLEAPQTRSNASGGGWGHNDAGGVESVGREGVALLLYSLLQANPGFLRAAVVRSDADALLLPLLQTLHDCASAEQEQQRQGRRRRPRWAIKTSASGGAAATTAVTGTTRGSRGEGDGPSPPVLYVPAIIVLLFSQDAAFNRQSFRQVVQGEVRWGGAARNLKGTSLGSLVVLAILRCLGHNLKRLKDGYLLENCLAVLVNIAPQAEHLKPYAAQRLVAVLIAASRRWIQGAEAAAAAAIEAQAPPQAGVAPGAAGGEGGVGGLVLPGPQADGSRGNTSARDVAGVGGGVAGSLAADVSTEVADGDTGAKGGGEGGGGGGLSDVQELCGEVARVLFRFVWMCTRPRRLGNNVELLYALLHEQASLDGVCNHPAMVATGWAGDLPRLLEHFQNLARQREEDGGGTGLTVESAMEVIEKGVRHYTTEAMGMGHDAGGDAAEDGRGGGGGWGRGMGGAGEDDGEEAITLLYEEGEHSEAFFLPYLWQVVLSRTPDLNWNPGLVRVLSPPPPEGAGSRSPSAATSPTEVATVDHAGGKHSSSPPPPPPPPPEEREGGRGGGGVAADAAQLGPQKRSSSSVDATTATASSTAVGGGRGTRWWNWGRAWAPPGAGAGEGGGKNEPEEDELESNV